MIQVCSFSTGLSSALMTLRVIEKFGKENTKIVFMDTLIEDEDNYRFMQDFENKFGVKIEKISYGLTPYELFDKQNIVPNQRVAPCTFTLKINQFKKYLEELNLKDITINIGYDYKEIHRVERTKQNYESLGYKVDFPLLWKPIIERDYKEIFINDYGINPPRMYFMGYSHANCGGMCIKQGMKDWKITFYQFPERFKKVMEWEKKREGKFTILKDRRSKSLTDGSKFKPLSLENFAKEYLNEEDVYCINCSIGDYSEE